MEREACGFRTHFPFLALALARKGEGEVGYRRFAPPDARRYFHRVWEWARERATVWALRIVMRIIK